MSRQDYVGTAARQEGVERQLVRLIEYGANHPTVRPI